ncbi:M16 family metallopeptidase [Crenobacter cavernae]|uniref:Insulinase family protein n=1 Tax=Crenobacter cavernae TaxID=2290923 RepID=A0A345Y3T6_9NEIS|nr:pitrilysin family protein [Crenobacter cavernae]AXK38588.1 insulinase family protein [Crenobacter cavernae]
MKNWHKLVVAGLFAAAAGAAAAETVEATLENGLKVVVRRDARAPVAVSQLWYRVGSVDEVNGRTGLSHLLEHMMFKGTKTVPAGEFSRRIAAAGGQDNAFTSRDYTVYFQQLAANRLPLSLTLESDRMANLTIADDVFKKELEVVKEERRWRTDDQPTGILAETLYANAFVANPVRYPVIGWMDDIQNMKPDDLRAWYREWYAPNNATLVVVGDVDPQAVIALARKEFEPLKSKTLAERRPQREPEQKGVRRVSVKAPSELSYLTLAWQVPRLTRLAEADPYALSMLTELLDGHDAARLPRHLVREKKVALSASSSYDPLGRGATLFTLTAVPANGADMGKLEAALKGEIARIAQGGVSEVELARVRRQVEASRVFEKDSMFGQAMQIGSLESLGFSWRDEDEMNRRLLAVDAAAVKRAAQSLVDDKLTVVTLVAQPLKGRQVAPPANPKELR